MVSGSIASQADSRDGEMYLPPSSGEDAKMAATPEKSSTVAGRTVTDMLFEQSMVSHKCGERESKHQFYSIAL